MKPPSCGYFNCHNPLLTTEAILAHLCNKHLDQIASKQYYVGICWNCGAITLIAEVPRTLRGVLREKYIFSKSCIKCTGKSIEDHGKWITIGKTEIPFHYEINAEGRIIRVSELKDRKAETELPVKSNSV